MPRTLWILLAVHAAVAGLLWLSGSPHGSWSFECGVGALAWDLGHGLNPDWLLPDYYDKWTTGYLLTALLAAPLMWVLPPIYALKLVALATSSGAAIAGWALSRRVAGKRAGLAAAALLLFCPPQLWFHATNAGDYHHSELAWELGMFAVLAELVVKGRVGRGWFALFGLLSGLTVLNSFASAPYAVLAGVGLLWLRPGVLRERAALWALPTAAAAVFPLVAKILAHHPFGVVAADDAYSLPYAASSQAALDRLHKLAVFPDRLADNLGFGDAAYGWGAAGLGHVIDVVVTAVLVLALLSSLRHLPALRRRESHALRLIPVLCALVLFGAYAVLPMQIVDGDLATGQFRDNRFLPPLIAFGLLAVAQGLRERVRVPIVASLVVVGLLGQLAVVSWGSLSPGIPYAGRCYDVLGLYASRHIDEGDQAAGDDEPWPRPELCAGFEERSAECWLGRGWGVGMRHLEGGWIPLNRPNARDSFATAASACRRLPTDALQRGCFRHAGWALNWSASSSSHEPTSVGLVRRCGAFEDPAEAAWCEEGLGFWIGDHYAGWPGKADALFQPVGGRPELADHVAHGLGAWIAHAYDPRESAEDLCRAWGEEGLPEASCLAGFDEVRSLRDAALPDGW